MTDPGNRPDDDHLFLALVTDLVTQAWVSLGKIKHPITDKLERNVPAAGMIIDMLDMLNRKTAGNRTEGEDRLLLDSLQQLKLNYIAEANKPEEPEEKAAHGEDVRETPETKAPDQEESAARRPSKKKAAGTKEAKPTGRKKTAARSSRQKKSGTTRNDQSARSTAPEENDT